MSQYLNEFAHNFPESLSEREAAAFYIGSMVGHVQAGEALARDIGEHHTEEYGVEIAETLGAAARTAEDLFAQAMATVLVRGVFSEEPVAASSFRSGAF